MRIKLAILEKNERFLSGFMNALNKGYSDKLEIYSFTDLEKAMSNLSRLGINVFLVSSNFNVDVSALPRNCSFAYLIGPSDNVMAEDYPVISKFTSVDMIYSEIVKICPVLEDTKPRITSSCRTVVFSSPCGGCGNSTVAAAFAIKMATEGFKTLYLNLEGFGSPDTFFSGEGKGNMSDIITAIKGKRKIILPKLKTCVRQDKSGVYFYAEASTALHILELTSGERAELLRELKDSASYDYIVIDMDYPLSVSADPVFVETDTIVLVSDGHEIPNLKVSRAYMAMEATDKADNYGISAKTVLLYNRTRSATSQEVDKISIKDIGKIQMIVADSKEEIIRQISRHQALDNLTGGTRHG